MHTFAHIHTQAQQGSIGAILYQCSKPVSSSLSSGLFCLIPSQDKSPLAKHTHMHQSP